MKYFIMLLVLFVAFSQQSFCQSIKFGLQSGIGFYSMPNLNEINKSVSEDLPFNTKLVSDFPPYWIYGSSLLIAFKNFNIGFNYSFQSTGSRVSANDYSGDYHFDLNVKANSGGIYGDIVYRPYKKIQISFYSKLNLAFSNLEITENLMVADSIIANSSNKFKSLNYFFEPGFNFIYSLTKYISIGINGGYILQFGNQAFYTGDNKDNILYNRNTRKPIKPEWDGFRVGLSIYFTMLKKESNQEIFI